MTLPTRDELAEILRTAFDTVVKETDDWRPVAGYILGVIQVCAKPEEITKTLNDLVRELIINHDGISEVKVRKLKMETKILFDHYRKLFNDGT